ncbi:group I intron-associated PD-(D/E)XK endonuclease [Sporichthya sp.]|uniref:group I intron-associated PD-(D/E)XK endonuclease n=1 Tax=Sporichthya sp. TaxID=65475 RepID=UPI0017AA7BE0|nr:group I intron-associated PD-(D/E)XK endonuclease [Sporichthya sp.]MBA3743300.1 hypothetical protein [Sporichthya sp.]
METTSSRPVRHHAKDKGDLGVACVITDLMKAGIRAALPMCEHLPFDLIAIAPDGRLSKVSVKFLSISSNGVLKVPGTSGWTDRHGVHKRQHQPGDYDAVAVYCPNTDRCYTSLHRNCAAIPPRCVSSRRGTDRSSAYAWPTSSPIRTEYFQRL